MADQISITPAEGTWVVRAGGAVLGESSSALAVSEGDRPVVIYFPRTDIAMAFLEPSETRTTCPLKGEATYFGIAAKSGLIRDAAWSYEAPKEAAAGIAGYLAFDPEWVAVEQV